MPSKKLTDFPLSFPFISGFKKKSSNFDIQNPLNGSLLRDFHPLPESLENGMA